MQETAPRVAKTVVLTYHLLSHLCGIFKNLEGVSSWNLSCFLRVDEYLEAFRQEKLVPFGLPGHGKVVMELLQAIIRGKYYKDTAMHA